MGSFKIKRLNLKKSIIETFERQSLRTCKDVLCLTVLEIQSLFGIRYEEALEIQNIVSEKCVSDPSTVYDLYLNEQKSFFPTSLDSLDALLQGGLLLGSVTEISGPPGVGKTQFCFLLSLLASVQGRVIYVDTESAFSAQRVCRIALKKGLCRTEGELSSVLGCISVCRASTVDALKEIIATIEKEIIQKQVKLVIIDSIASLFRKEYGAVRERNNILVEQAARLKDIAQTYNIVIFLTNQVTSHSANSEILTTEDEEEPLTDSSEEWCEPACKRLRRASVIPALGITWFHCVNTRLVARFMGLQVCQLRIAKSPVAPNAAIQYTLDEAGFHILDDGAEIDMCDAQQPSLLTKNHFLTEAITGHGVV